MCRFEVVVAQPVAHAALGEALGRALDGAPQLDGDLPPLEVEALQPRLHLAAEVRVRGRARARVRVRVRVRVRIRDSGLGAQGEGEG